MFGIDAAPASKRTDAALAAAEASALNEAEAMRKRRETAERKERAVGADGAGIDTVNITLADPANAQFTTESIERDFGNQALSLLNLIKAAEMLQKRAT